MGRRKRTSRKSGSGLTLVHNSPRMPMMPEMDLDRSIIPISMSPQGSMNPMMMGSPLPHGLVSPVILSGIKSPRPYKKIVVPIKSPSKSARRLSGKKKTGRRPAKPKGKKPSSQPVRRAVHNVVKKVTPTKYINKPKRSSSRKSSSRKSSSRKSSSRKTSDRQKSMDEAMKRLSAPKRSSRKSSSTMSTSKKRQLRRDFMKEQADIENML